MIIFPAIDLKEGKCVRLYRGDMQQATIFNDSPATQALEFQNYGFKYLHIVDLDGAVAGKSMNEKSVKEVLDVIKIPVQLGGGIRTMADVDKWLGLGVSRVIIGTAAATNPDFVKEACNKYPNQIVVGIDARDGMVATQGWVETSEIKAIDLAKKYEDCGVAAIVYTDISRDGTLSGVSSYETKLLASDLSIPVIASGGVSSMNCIDDILQLNESGIIGVIVGRALYDKMIDPASLVELQNKL